MIFFWGDVFEYFKDRRYAAVFFGTLAATIVFLALGGIFYKAAADCHLLQYRPYSLLGLYLLLLALVWHGIYQMRERRLNRYKVSPLSRDEVIKARSKLVKQK